MSVLGVRCSNKDFTYVIMSGSKENPKINTSETNTYPRNFSKPRVLLWFVQEIELYISRHDAKRIVLKGFEGRSRGKTYEQRVEYEAAVFIAAARKGVNAVYLKVKSTIAKDLGLKGRAHYLETSLDTSHIPGYATKTNKEKDAILAAWSELR